MAKVLEFQLQHQSFQWIFRTDFLQKITPEWVSEVAQSCPNLCDLWTVAYQAPPSMGLSRQEYWSGLPFPSPVDLPHPGIKPRSPTLEEDALTSEPPIIPTSALLTMPKPLTMWVAINCGKFLKRWEYQITWPASWETSMQVRKQQLELDMEQQTGSK